MTNPTNITQTLTLALAALAAEHRELTPAQQQEAAKSAERAAARPLTPEERAEELYQLATRLAGARQAVFYLSAQVRGHTDALLRDQAERNGADVSDLPV